MFTWKLNTTCLFSRTHINSLLILLLEILRSKYIILWYCKNLHVSFFLCLGQNHPSMSSPSFTIAIDSDINDIGSQDYASPMCILPPNDILSLSHCNVSSISWESYVAKRMVIFSASSKLTLHLTFRLTK